MEITLEVKDIVSLILALVIADGSVTSGIQKYCSEGTVSSIDDN